MNDMLQDEHPSDAPQERISKRATGPSRSQRRREALDVLDLAGKMMDAPDGMVARLPMTADLADVLAASRRIRQHGARKRQMQFLAKQLRRLDDGELEALRAVFEVDQTQVRRETARLHRLEALRERLLDGGDEALAELLADYPQADRNRLRQWQRQAARERQQTSTPRAARELFRYLRELLGGADSGDQPADGIADGRGDGDR